MIDTKPIDDEIENLEQDITRLKVIKNTAEMIVNRLEDKFGELEANLILYLNLKAKINIYIKDLIISIFFNDDIFEVNINFEFKTFKSFTDFNKVVNYIIEEVGG